MEIKITKASTLKPEPDWDNLGFGKYYTDHMFIMDYTEGIGWHDARIVPYAPMMMDPATMIFHYGQGVFEGLKAYKGPSGEIRLFRPEKNMSRLNISNDRLCIPEIDEEFAVKAIKTLVKMEERWIPTAPGTSLYIRPFIIATDAHIGVHASKTYQFIIILSPVSSYYAAGLKPVSIYVESEYVRAVKGGMGYAKTAGNYSASLKAQQVAEKRGYSQVLWLDGVERKYIEEVGAMNIFFVIGDEITTPMLNGSILPGITRDSTLQLLRAKGYNATERRISADELYEAYQKGELKEVFGTGTAAVISPVGELLWDGHKMIINSGEIGKISQMIYDTITGIQSGRLEDEFGWIQIVE